MAENEDNVFYLDSYRTAANSETADRIDAGKRLSFHTGGEIAAEIRSDAIESGDEMPDIFKEIVAFGLAHRRMMREGWDGPTYTRTLKHKGILGKLGLSKQQTIHFAVKPPEE